MTYLVAAPQSSSSASAERLLPSVYLVGQLPHETVERVLDAARLAGHRVCHVKGPKEARLLLARRGSRPKGILVDASADDRGNFIQWLREEATLFDVPVIAVVHTPTEEACLLAKQSGADDVVVGFDHEGIARRLQALDEYVNEANPPATCGTAVVAHPDDHSRRQLGWVLRRAGYALAFAATREELETVAVNNHPALILVAQELLPPGEPCVAACELREGIGHPDLPLVVVTENPRDAAEWQRVPRAAATSGKAWDRVLFLASELMRLPLSEQRATPRVFFSAFCAFRPSDQMMPTCAVTYNISEGGLFVRTLDPPKAGSVVAINLRLPPASAPVVTVHAKVVWIQRPTHGCTGPTPGGFGAQILEQDSPAKDLEEYRVVCRLLHAEASGYGRIAA